MAKSLVRFVMIALVIFLVISGLNISNQAINSLTGENRKPILNYEVVGQDLSLYILGNTYVFSGEKLGQKISQLRNFSISIYHRGSDYLHKIWHIYQVIFLDNWVDCF